MRMMMIGMRRKMIAKMRVIRMKRKMRRRMMIW